MKIIVKSTVLIAAVMCALLPAYAAESAQYGKNLTQVFVGGRTADGTFEDYMTDGDDSWKREVIPFNGTVFFDEGASGDRSLVAEITDEEARNGKNSLKFDMDALARCSTNSDKSARLILQKNINYKKPGITYYYEAWVKLRDETKAQLLGENLLSEFSYPAMIRLDDYGNNGKYTNDKAFAHSDGEKDENGWRKISITKKCIDTDGVLKIGPSVYNLRAEGEGLGVIYYDDISAYALPDSMRAECAKKIYDPDEAPLLSDIKVYGCDAAGNEEEFVDYSNIKYSVESGEAEIKEGKLYYNGESNGNVVLKVEFAGLTSEITLKFGTPIKIYGISRNADNSCRVIIGDTTSQGLEVTVMAAVFDANGIMRKMVSTPKTKLGNPSVIMTPAVNTEGIEEPKVKIFIWDSLSRMTPYADITEAQ